MRPNELVRRRLRVRMMARRVMVQRRVSHRRDLLPLPRADPSPSDVPNRAGVHPPPILIGTYSYGHRTIQ